MIWLTADLHLGEDRFSLINRPFETVDEHVDCLVNNFNRFIDPSDELYVIGDAVYQRSPRSVKHLARFNGKKTLIRGNHDKVITDEV